MLTRAVLALLPLLVNTVVGFIGPEYLYDGKQITRAGLEDHFCGKLLGVPMKVDNYIATTPKPIRTWTRFGSGCSRCQFHSVLARTTSCRLSQSTSFHDALAMRDLYGRKPAPEFEAWLARHGLMDAAERIRPREMPPRFRAMLPA